MPESTLKRTFSSPFDNAINSALSAVPIKRSRSVGGVTKFNLHQELLNNRPGLKESPQIKIAWMKLKLKNATLWRELNARELQRRQRGLGGMSVVWEYAMANDKRLLTPWDDPGDVTIAFRTALTPGSVMKVLKLLNKWESYFNKVLTAFQNAQDNVSKVIETDRDKRAERRKAQINFGLALFGMALNAFGLSPLTGIISGTVNQWLNTHGLSNFGSNYVTNSDGLLTSNMYAKYGGDDASQAGENLWREGSSSMIMQSWGAMTGAALGKFSDKMHSLLAPNMPPMPDDAATFRRFLDHIKDAFINLKDSAEQQFIELFDQYQKPEVCLMITERTINKLVEGGLFTDYDMGRFKEVLRANILQPTTTRLEAEMASAFECPVKIGDSASIDLKAIERLMVAMYFRGHKEGFLKKDKKTNELKDDARLKMNDTIRNYLLSLNIAKKRDYTVLYQTDSKDRRRQDEMNQLTTALQSGSTDAQLMLGKHESNYRDMVDAIKWAEVYPVQQELERVLYLDKEKVKATSNITAELFKGGLFTFRPPKQRA